MKYQNLSRPIFAFALVCLVASTLLNCSSDTKTTTTEPGAAGEAGGDAAPSVTICGKLASSGSTCDPVTAAGCDIAGGETCDYEPTAFTCYPGPNIAKAGDLCGTNETAAFCGATTTCDGALHQCVHYCCTDSDCERGKCGPGFTDGAASVGACTGEFAGLDVPGEAGASGEAAAGAGGVGG